MSDAPDTAGFNKNYKVLKETADWLSQQQEPDIDQLVPRVESAMRAYKACKMRLDAVQATLSQYFEADGAGIAGEGTPHAGNGKSRRPVVPADGDEEDIPF